MFATLASIALQVVTVAKPLPATKPVSPPAAVASPGKMSNPAPADSGRPTDEVRIASQRYAAAVRGCYEREGLKRDPALGANVDVTVSIDPHGMVRQVRVDTLDVHGLGMSDVVTCIQGAAMQWQFSSGTYAVEEMTFSYKLVPPAPASRE
jgi:hypothetical protein